MGVRVQTGAGERVLVVGDDAVGVVTARSVPGTVTFAGLDERMNRRLDDSAVDSVLIEETRQFDPPAESVDTAIVATGADSLNLLYAQRLRVDGRVSDIVARVNDPHYHDVFTDLGIATVCATTDVSQSLTETHSQLVE